MNLDTARASACGCSTSGSSACTHRSARCGRRIWNRHEYRKHPESGKRISTPRPRSEWVFSDMPELRIVDQDLWDAVKARQDGIARTIDKAEAAGRTGLGARNGARRRLHRKREAEAVQGL